MEFKKFLEDFCRDFLAMSTSDESPGTISIEGSEVDLPANTAIPLGFIASELITNAAKYGKGRIAIRLESDPKHRYALSVANDQIKESQSSRASLCVVLDVRHDTADVSGAAVQRCLSRSSGSSLARRGGINALSVSQIDRADGNHLHR